jgi:glucose/arabinose dehydrogenase
MRPHPRLSSIVFALCALLPHATRAQVLVPGFGDSIIARNLDLPVAFDFLPDGRLVFAEQASGRLRLLVNGQFTTTDPIVTVPNVRYGGERGLLGVAVDPEFPARPYLYTHQTHTDGHIRISRWTLAGDLALTGNGAMSADPASRYDLLTTLPDAAGNHNGGTVRFGTDGMLYVSLGDDASNCNAQVVDSLKGKILRLRVSTLPAGPGLANYAQLTPPDNPYVARPDSGGRLVYAYGLRNPFRFQVDEARNCLVIGDVGLDTYEEVNLLALPGGSGADLAPAGSNFGWPWFEGDMAYMGCGGTAPAYAHAIYIFDRTNYPGASLICGPAYHVRTGGSANFPNRYEGDIFFGEYSSGEVFRLKRTGSTWALAPAESGQANPLVWASGFESVADWRVGPDGALWACRQFVPGTFRNAGTIERIAYVSSAGVPPGTSSYQLRLSAYPTPSSGPVTLAVQSDTDQAVHVRVYDLRGRLVRDLGTQRAIAWSVTASVVWDGLDDEGRKAPNGVYYARVEANGQDARCPVVLAR